MSDDPNKPVARAKPKFQPKLSQPIIDQSIAVKKEQQERTNKNFERKNGGGGRGRGERDGGRGRGRFQTPQGVAFFRGSQQGYTPSAPVASSFNSKIHSNSGHSGVKAEGANGEEVKSESGVITKPSRVIDSDSSSDSDNDRIEFRSETVWPPENIDILAPIELPIGPKSAELRASLDKKPMFANPTDRAAVEEEENVDMFLLQLPTEFKLAKQEKKNITTTATTATAAAVPTEKKPGGRKLGKLQVHQSGKVFLVTDDGKRFEVYQGVTASFAQYISSIRVTQPENSAGNETKSVAPTKGDHSLLGCVTKKLVAVPDFDINTTTNIQMPVKKIEVPKTVSFSELEENSTLLAEEDMTMQVDTPVSQPTRKIQPKKAKPVVKPTLGKQQKEAVYYEDGVEEEHYGENDAAHGGGEDEYYDDEY